MTGRGRAPIGSRSGWYTETSLLVSMMFYACFGSVFIGIFVVRYHIELMLFTPLAAGLFAFYFSSASCPTARRRTPSGCTTTARS